MPLHSGVGPVSRASSLLSRGPKVGVCMTSYEFRFRQRAAFERAFLDVLSCAYVEDCLVDRSALKLRFRANGEPEVQRLYERIKLQGELAPRAPEPSARLRAE